MFNKEYNHCSISYFTLHQITCKYCLNFSKFNYAFENYKPDVFTNKYFLGTENGFGINISRSIIYASFLYCPYQFYYSSHYLISQDLTEKHHIPASILFDFPSCWTSNIWDVTVIRLVARYPLVCRDDTVSKEDIPESILRWRTKA